MSLYWNGRDREPMGREMSGPFSKRGIKGARTIESDPDPFLVEMRWGEFAIPCPFQLGPPELHDPLARSGREQSPLSLAFVDGSFVVDVAGRTDSSLLPSDSFSDSLSLSPSD